MKTKRASAGDDAATQPAIKNAFKIHDRRFEIREIILQEKMRSEKRALPIWPTQKISIKIQ